jgi:hypothetical protein
MSRRLSDLEEQITVQFILDLDFRGFPSRLRFVKEMANSLLADRDASPVGKRWAHNFIERQLELKTHLLRKYDYQRAKYEDSSTCVHYSIEWKLQLRKGRLSKLTNDTEQDRVLAPSAF